MKLTVIIIIYALIVIAAATILALTLRKAMKDEVHRMASVIVPVLILLLAMAFPLIGALVPDGPLCWFFQKWGNIFIGYVIYFYLALFAVGIIAFLTRKMRGAKNASAKSTAKAMLVIPLMVTIVINIMGVKTAHDVQVTRYHMDKEALNQTEPLRIVLFADTHIGVNSSVDLYQDMVERINAEKPDIVLMAGDMFTSSFNAMKDPKAYSKVLSKIESRYGVYAVYGNHDVDEPLLGGFTYASKEEALRNPKADSWVEDCNWILLRDEVVRIPELKGLVIAGRRDSEKPGDGFMERAELKDLLKGVKPEEPIILLQHEPSNLKELDEYGVDLSLSGHTHDGQIFPGNYITGIFSELSYGMKEFGDSTAVVTSGVGYYGPPIRVDTISEIVVIDLE